MTACKSSSKRNAENNARENNLRKEYIPCLHKTGKQIPACERISGEHPIITSPLCVVSNNFKLFNTEGTTPPGKIELEKILKRLNYNYKMVMFARGDDMSYRGVEI